MARTHYFPDDRVHYVWDNEQEPVITVEPGDTVVYHTREVSDGQITPDSDASVLDNLDWDRLYPLAGPVAMANAEPGDVLAVEVLDIHTQGWGWTAVLPGFGLLPEDFPDAYLKIFDLTNGDYTHFKDDIVIPIEPFFGTMGVSPAGPEKPAVMPPGPFGGNMDTRHITKGSILYLPVQHEGALFSCGDAHAAQGDGEVCGTAIESPMTVTVTLDLVKDANLTMPRFTTHGPVTRHLDEKGYEVTTGIGTDLMEGARIAVSQMIDLLCQRHGMSAVDAYMLCSVCADLRISEIVDQPNWVVSFYFPRVVLD